RLDTPGGPTGFVELLQPVRSRPLAELGIESRDQRLTVCDPLRLGVEARILREILPPHGAAHALPERVVRHTQREVGVLGLENLVGNDGRMLVAAAGPLSSPTPSQPCPLPP